MFIFDEEVLDKLKTLKDKDEAYDFIYEVTYPYSEDIDHGFFFNKINCCKKCSYIFSEDKYLLLKFDLSFPETQKMFKVAENIIKYAIENENYDIIDIVDETVEYMFFSHENLDYLFESDYITWCTYTYRKILKSNDIYKEKHKKRYIDPRIYKDKRPYWYHINYILIENILDKIEISDEMISEITQYNNITSPTFNDHNFLKLLYFINSNTVSIFASKYNIENKDVLKIINSK